MRVMQVNAADLGGGAYVIGWDLFRSLRARGHDATMAVGFKRSDDPNVFEIPNAAESTRWARRLKPVEARVRERGRAAVLAPAVAVAAEPHRAVTALAGHEDFDYPGTRHLLDLPSERPEIVHAHNLHGGYFDLRLLPELSAAAPFAMTLHDAWLLSGHCAHSFDCEGWRSGCGNCPDLTIYPRLIRDGTAYNFRRKHEIYSSSRLFVATPSQWLMRKVEASMLGDGIAETRVIPNGVDLGVFRPGDREADRRALRIGPETKMVLFAANWAASNKFKDFATLEAAVERLAAGGREILFVCIGEGGAERHSGSATIRFVDWVSQPELARHYRAADVYLHAARAETFPTTIIEAMACGTPVVATAVGGIPEQIEDGATGQLVPVGDAAAMAERAAALLDDGDARDAMGARGAAAARERFGLERMVDDYLEWYERILEATSGATR